MILYRVENKRGVGPYMSFARGLDAMVTNHTDDDHPTPGLDGLGSVKAGEICGLPTIGALAEWFEGWGKPLQDANFHIAEYETTKFRMGNTQVVFTKDTATCTATYEVMDYIQ